jgi:hypothetical protein
MVAATKTAVPPLNGGTCDHDSEANHALTVANGSTWMAVVGAARSAARTRAAGQVLISLPGVAIIRAAGFAAHSLPINR